MCLQLSISIKFNDFEILMYQTNSHEKVLQHRRLLNLDQNWFGNSSFRQRCVQHGEVPICSALRESLSCGSSINGLGSWWLLVSWLLMMSNKIWRERQLLVHSTLVFQVQVPIRSYFICAIGFCCFFLGRIFIEKKTKKRFEYEYE